jgi:oligopeptide/dipeptide ABC transporter ATP-binding protein
MEKKTLLEIKDLRTHFFLEEGELKALDGVSFDIAEGETLGVVGESGCGKSLTALSVMRLVPSPPGRIVGGSILFEGKDLLEKKKKEMRKIRGNDIAMIFQEPMTSLNPVFTVGYQIMETLMRHQHMTRKQAWKKAVETLELVKMPLAEQRMKEYPHQLSGGMRQRVMIAMAVACNPKLLICDEPTTALDVTVQAQILKLINELKKECNMSVMMITHDLGVISEIADRVIVMYAGRIVEMNDGKSIFEQPLHPYTAALLRSIPQINEQKETLYMIKGMVPNILKEHKGCLFAPRCEECAPVCLEKEPELFQSNGKSVRCWKYTDAGRKLNDA